MRFSGFVMLATAVALVAAAPAGAQLINEDFEGVAIPDLPSGWTADDANADTYTWTSYGSYYCSGGQGASVRWNFSQSMDDWLYTPGVALTAGWTYTLTFWYNAAGATFPEDLTVYIGTSAAAAAMTTQLVDLPGITSTTCLQATVTDFTVPTTGTYYIGFHGHSAEDMFRLNVDDVLLVNTGVPVELMSFDVE